MPIDALVLQALLRLTRRRAHVGLADLLERIESPPGALRAALSRLDSDGLVERRAGYGPRLTLTGLAVAVAVAGARIAPRRQSSPSGLRLGRRRAA